MRYALVGYGRMGRAVEDEAAKRGHELVGRFDVDSFSPALERGTLAQELAGAEVAFEFTTGEAAAANVRALLEVGLAVVCGTTGWTPEADLERCAKTAGRGAVVAPNFSVGMNLFYRLVRKGIELYAIEDLYHPYVVEWHHRGKRDLPSGTARHLGRLIADTHPRIERVCEGDPGGALDAAELHVTGVRAGQEAGTHEVGFDGPHDLITLRHRARSRAAFGAGAVLAGEWVVDKQGVHGFDAVLDALLEQGGSS